MTGILCNLGIEVSIEFDRYFEKYNAIRKFILLIIF